MTRQLSKPKSKTKKRKKRMSITLIGRAKTCEACHEADAYFKRHKSRFKYKYIDVDSDLGSKYVLTESITTIPFIIGVLPDGVIRKEQGWDQNDWE